MHTWHGVGSGYPLDILLTVYKARMSLRWLRLGIDEGYTNIRDSFGEIVGLWPWIRSFWMRHRWSIRRSRIGSGSSSAQASQVGFTLGLVSWREF